MKKNLTFGGGEVIITGNDKVDVTEITFFDELEYDCWNLICDYMKAFGFNCTDLNGDENCIDFYAAKEVQETILKLFEDAGVKFTFGRDE